ncbi:MAG: hypothetical protein RL609_1276 [Bacteroidota bacterium]|jgi:hypothetical protein
MNKIIYPSAISWGIWIPVYALIIGQGIFMAGEMSTIFLVTHFSLAILIYFFVVRIRYELDEENLTIYMGPVRYRKIALTSIRKMELSNNPLSSPAASLKRIAIHYDKWGYVLISPKNREEFIAEVQDRKKKLEIC